VQLLQCAVLASTALLAAVLVVSSRHPRAPTALLGKHLDMDAVCAQATAGARTMQQQAALCSESLCGSSPAELAGTSLAECSACGTTVNINLPGSLPYYYYPTCVQSSYDPWEWYDYYYKYDPALAPYYEPWTPPETDISVEAPEEEEEGAVEEVPEVTAAFLHIFRAAACDAPCAVVLTHSRLYRAF